jgi:prevent-host-death family protein
MVQMQRVRSISVSEARALLANLIEQVEVGEPYLLVSRSRVRAVLMGIGQYDALLERLEDMEDSLEILRAKAEGEPTRPLEDYLNEREAKQTVRVSRRP